MTIDNECPSSTLSIGSLCVMETDWPVKVLRSRCGGRCGVWKMQDGRNTTSKVWMNGEPVSLPMEAFG